VVTSGQLERKNDAREQFAMAQFLNMDDATKLSRPSFQPGDGGIELGATGDQLATSHMARRVVRYEEILIDGEYRRHQRKSRFSTGLFAHHLRGSAVTMSKLSAARKTRFDPFGNDKVKVGADKYVVASTDTNVALAAAAFGSEAEARDHLNQLAASDPGASKALHVIPVSEAA